jgi:signal transduction histidine kinase
MAVSGNRANISKPENINPKKLLTRIASRVTHRVGENYLRELVESLTDVLQIDIAFVGEKDVGKDSIRTVALVDRGKHQSNFEYELAFTPCENVVDNKTCCYQTGIQDLFPKDILLQEMGVVSYSGTPLFDSKGSPIGIIVLLGRSEIEDPDLVRSVVEVYSDRAAAELERQVYERSLLHANEELQRAKEEAESASRVKTEFLTSMSHELRTPLNAILGFAQILESDTIAPLSPRQVDYLNYILDGGSHLLDLINQVLDLGRIEADQIDLQMQKIDIAQVVAECANLSDPGASERSIKIGNDTASLDGVTVVADRVRLKQILLNLLSNAIKYNKEGGIVTISSNFTSDDILRISISDTGIGIDERYRKDIFQMFHRLSVDTNLSKEGTGIGLSVTRLLIEKMNGQIGYESKVDVGSTFWIELPMVRRPG